MPSRRIALALCALFACTLVACDSSVRLSSATSSADGFLAALSDRDAARMASLLAQPQAERWSASHVRKWLRRILALGGVTSVSARRTGPSNQPASIPNESPSPAPVATVPYAVTYTSAAARRPATLQGRLHLAYVAGDHGWRVRWDKSILFPGVKGAAGLRASYRWLRRGRILDRDGRLLAKGTGESRTYPFGSLAGSTLGTYAPVTEETLKDHPEHDVGDLVGATGLEAGLEDRLAGSPAGRFAVVDRSGRVVRTLGRTTGKPGKDVRTTLDMAIERVATAALGASPGGAIVLDPRNGDVLAVVASSPFDPNGYVGVPGIRPFNRALSGLYPPGSSMKVVTSAAGLDTGVVTPGTRLTGPKDFRGVHNFEGESFSSLTFAQALQYSVNTSFAQVGLKLGAKRFMRYVDAFGFNRAPDLAVGAASSSVPPIEDDYDLMYSAFGQAQVLATPLEMASVVATVANDGVRMDPRITKSAKPGGHRVVKIRTAATLTRLLERVVQAGTGTRARIPGVAVAGKTGTAEVDTAEGRKNHAWFLAFAPAGAPELAVAVVVEYGGVGGEVAAPIARDIMTGALPLAG